jgi:ubiquinone biosynthesis protein UbiJ
MATQSPFSLLEGFFQNLPLPNLQPPVWAVDEAQRRIVLLLNHILIQEKEATNRLARQKGRVVRMQWRAFTLDLIASPAGLLDLAPAPADSKPDLVLAVTEESPFALAQATLRGDKPAVRIEGDVQLAAEVNWLTDHVRWDIEEDLSRVMGDAPAHALAQAVGSMAGALRQFLASRKSPGQDKAST